MPGPIPESIGNATSLGTLILRDNVLNGSIPTGLRNCTNLQLIDFQDNQLSGTIPQLAQLVNLRIFSLARNQLTGNVPEWLGNLSQLQALVLSEKSFSGTIPTEMFSGMKAWFQIWNGTLDTSETIYEEFPVNIGQDRTFQYMIQANTVFDVSSNQIVGTIPPDIGALVGLRILNLSHNRLEGSIPGSFGELHSSEYMDLSHNLLSGNIPRDLSSLDSLSYFSVADNNLSGPIPTGGQFSTWNVSSFLPGNPGLCGAPLQPCSVPNELPGAGNDPSPVQAVNSDDADTVISKLACEMGFFVGFCATLTYMFATKRIRQMICLTGRYRREPEQCIVKHGLYRSPQ